MAVECLIGFDGVVGWGKWQVLFKAEVQPSLEAASYWY